MKRFVTALIFAILTLFVGAKPLAAFDARTIKMQLVLEDYHSPMAKHAKELIEIAEANHLDWTLMAAIAGTESSFGRRMPQDCLNPYGWGIYPGHRICFTSFPEAAGEVASGLAKRYNTTSLATIAKTYNHVSPEAWQAHTAYFINLIKNKEIPVSKLPITL